VRAGPGRSGMRLGEALRVGVGKGTESSSVETVGDEIDFITKKIIINNTCIPTHSHIHSILGRGSLNGLKSDYTAYTDGDKTEMDCLVTLEVKKTWHQ